MYKRIGFLLFSSMLLTSVINLINGQLSNTLSPKEKAEGWQLLFDGKDLKGWHSYLQNKPGKAWQVQNGTIALNKNSKSVYEDFADLVSDEEFENFHLKLEWKLEPCGNSGLMFYVHESPEYRATYETGPEMQIVDLYCSGDSRVLMNRAGDLYDLAAADTEWVTTGGKWNLYEVKAENGHLQLFQNGHKIIEMDMWDDHWREQIARTKFASMPNFGTFKKGHISFQGTENGKLWFRNIKIKKL